jgi:hypothetical protein
MRRAVILLAATLLMAACSSDDESAESAPATATTTPPSTASTTARPATTTAAPTTTLATTTITSTRVDETADPFPREALLGSWMLQSGYVVTFGDDGRWAIADPQTPDDPFDFGPFEFEAATLVMTTDPAVTSGCSPGDTGSFRLSPPDPDGVIDSEVIQDPCSPRRNDFSAALTPHEP